MRKEQLTVWRHVGKSGGLEVGKKLNGFEADDLREEQEEPN